MTNRSKSGVEAPALRSAGPDVDLVLVREAAEFASTHITPEADRWEIERHIPEQELRLAASRFAGLLAPREAGGLESSVATASAVLGELARGDLAFAFSLVVHANLTNALARSGSEALCARFLPGLLSGEAIGAFCLTEPDVGTDAAGIQTRAHKQNKGWRISGQKAWVTNGAFADLLSVYVKLPPQAAPEQEALERNVEGASEIATFLVPASSPGIERLPPYALLGSHIMGTAGFELDACSVSPAQMLFAPGEGFQAAMAGIDLARVLLSAMCCAILQQALEVATNYARNRKAFGKPTLGFQGLQWQLANVATNLEAAMLLTEKAVTLLDRGESATLAAAHAKKTATRVAFDGISTAMQAMGAAGLRREYPLARQLSNARTAQYLDGTTEVQNIVISRRL